MDEFTRSDHKFTATFDPETGLYTVECEMCNTRLILSPQTYEDLLIAVEMDAIVKEFEGQK